MRTIEFDGVLMREIILEDGVLHQRVLQPGRAAILEKNRELQKNPDALRAVEGMGWELDIPVADYHVLTRLFPELESSDPDINTKAWQAFLASPISDPYRVRSRLK